jgi:hypothetical protein
MLVKLVLYYYDRFLCPKYWTRFLLQMIDSDW